MNDEFSLVCLLKPAVPLGFSIYPCLCKRSNSDYLTVIERLTVDSQGEFFVSKKVIQELVALSNSIESDVLAKRFSKKEIPPSDYWRSVDNNMLQQLVRPYMEKILARMIEIVRLQKLALFEAKYMPNLYPVDQIHFFHETANATLRFRRSENGTFYTFEARLNKLKVNLQHPSNLILTREPCLYLSQKQLFTFDNSIDGKLLIPFLKKESIEIPARVEKQYFGSFIRKIVGRCDIMAEGFKIMDMKAEPNAVLSLENDWQGGAVLVLYFTYGEKKIRANVRQRTLTELQTDNDGFVFKRIKREEAWENTKISFLKSIGIQQFEATFSLLSYGKYSSMYAMVEWITLNHTLLEENGFKIEQAHTSQFCFEPARVSLSCETKVDLFDIRAEVSIGEFSIPFYKFKNHILNGWKEYHLPNDTVFLLPETWFARYRELLLFAKEQQGIMSLQKHHYRILQGFDLPDIAALIAQENTHEPFRLPTLSHSTLRPYQIFGFGWMKQLSNLGFGSLLADDMGLGKTIQVIALLASYYTKAAVNQPADEIEHIEYQPIVGTQLDLFAQAESCWSTTQTQANASSQKIEKRACSLLVMPASLIHNWVNELRRFVPHLKVYAHIGAGRNLSMVVLKRHDLVLTTYGTLRNDVGFLENYSFAYIVLDESQNIKNPTSKTTMAAVRLKGVHRIALTGTPVENSLNDLWSQMNFLNPGVLGNLSDFNTYYAIKLANKPEDTAGEELLNIIKPFILRRTKDEVSTELPPVTETMSYCTMNTGQLELYETEKSNIRNSILAGDKFGEQTKSSVMVLKALMKLRQIANHPSLIDPDSKLGSGKFDAVTEKLETILLENHKILIFSSFVKHLHLFEMWCQENIIQYAMLTGATLKREKVVNAFKNDPGIKIFLISLKAGGVGLNLAEADYVFILDPWWNPAAEMQAISRAHRIGQDKKVFVYRFIAQDTVEEKIIRLQEKKKTLADTFILSDSTIAGMSSNEVMELFD